MIDHPLLIQSNFLVSKICNSRPLFILSCHQSPVLYMFFMKLCWWLDSNYGRLLVPKATTLSTESQPLSYVILSSFFPKLKLRQSVRPRRVLKKKKQFFGAKIIFWRKFHFTTTEEFFTIQKCWNLASKESEKIEIVLKKEKEKAALTPEKIFFYF